MATWGNDEYFNESMNCDTAWTVFDTSTSNQFNSWEALNNYCTTIRTIDR